MQFCKIHARRISSKSLKRLCVTTLSSFPEDFHIRIFAPGLTELVLDGFKGLPPFLEYMPLLVTARLGLEFASTDFCDENHDCGCRAYPVEGGLLLNGLSNAINLELREFERVCLHLLPFFNSYYCHLPPIVSLVLSLSIVRPAYWLVAYFHWNTLVVLSLHQWVSNQPINNIVA
jgi:hypothetical protein